MEIMTTPYGRFNYIELSQPNDKGKRTAVLMLPKNLEAMAGLIDSGLPKDIAETNVKDVEKFRTDLAAMIKEDGKHPKFNAKVKLFKDGDAYADQVTENWKDDEENAGKEPPAWLDATRNYWMMNAKTGFDLDFYGPRKSEGKRDDTWADSEIYNGSWGRFPVKPNDYNVDGNKGYTLYISFWVQKWADDEKLGGDGGSSGGGPDDAVEFVPKASANDYID